MFHMGGSKPGGSPEKKKKGGDAGASDGPAPQERPEAGAADGRAIGSEILRNILSESQDIVFSEISAGGRHITTVFVDGLVDSKIVDDDVLKPLVQEEAFKAARSEQELVDLLMLGNAYHCQRQLRRKLDDCIGDLLSGSVALVFDEAGAAVTFELKGFEKRGISEPTNENVLKGSKECFIEVLRTNTALVRRRIATRDLIVSQLKVGVRTSTSLAVVYLRGVANHHIVDEVTKRLRKINIDGIISAGQIETFLMDERVSIFPQLLYTERVDKFCGHLLEGRVGVLIDGMPIAYIVPVDLFAFLQAPEDYALHFFQSSVFRLLRNLSALSALILPAFYVAITTFHQEMIPTKLAMSIIESKKAVPFPTVIEVLLMLLAFEILLEAGLRLPKSIGQTVSIIGALVVGDAAITAKILSPGVVIVIATAGITGFVIPSQDLANTVRILRLLLVFCSLFGGLFGIGIGMLAISYHLCTLEIFGVPYLSPFVSGEGRRMFYDTVVRASWLRQKIRPRSVRPEDDVRQG